MTHICTQTLVKIFFIPQFYQDPPPPTNNRVLLHNGGFNMEKEIMDIILKLNYIHLVGAEVTKSNKLPPIILSSEEVNIGKQHLARADVTF